MIDEKVLKFISRNTEESVKYLIDARTWKALQLRLGFVDGIQHTYDSIGRQLENTHGCYKYSKEKVMGISQERVRQLIVIGVIKIQKIMREDNDW